MIAFLKKLFGFKPSGWSNSIETILKPHLSKLNIHKFEVRFVDGFEYSDESWNIIRSVFEQKMPFSESTKKLKKDLRKDCISIYLITQVEQKFACAIYDHYEPFAQDYLLEIWPIGNDYFNDIDLKKIG